MKTVYDVIKGPIITEKSALLTEVAKRYVFKVSVSATKNEIKDAIQKIFEVRVRKVWTSILPGKTKRNRLGVYKKNNTKKAIISLAQGQKIDFKL